MCLDGIGKMDSCLPNLDGNRHEELYQEDDGCRGASQLQNVESRHVSNFSLLLILKVLKDRFNQS